MAIKAASTAMLGYQAIPELIRRSELPAVFCMLGGTNVQWIAAGVQTGAFTFVKTRHEDTAVSAATGFTRSTGRIGVCSVTRGPGFANAVNALRAATHDHVPVLMIVGESPATKVRTSQNIDQRGLTGIIGAGFHHVAGAGELEDAYWSALKAAHFNGVPQVLSLADGVLDATISLTDATSPPLRPEEPPDPEAITAAVDVLERAGHPLVLAGQGAMLADCRSDLDQLARLTGARVASTLNVNRYFAGHEHDLGVCGTSSPPDVLDRLEEVDAVLAVGATLNGFTTRDGQLFAGRPVIQCEIDVDQPFMASAIELGILGDARQSVTALIAEWRRRGLGERPVRGSTPTREQMRSSLRKIDLGHDPARGLDPRAVHTVFDRKLPSDRIVVTDSSRSLATMPTLVDAPDARSWLVSRGYGSIGLGLGAAIGAAAGNPTRPVALFCGDGGFMMSSHDLDAIRINGLDMTIVIMNDEQYGSELGYLNAYRLDEAVARQPMPDVVALARAFGGDGAVVATEDELDALELPGSGLFIVDVRVDPRVNARAAF